MPAYDKRVKVVTDGEDEKVLVVNQDIVTTSPASGDLLVFENGQWTVRHLATGDMPSAMATDAEVTAAVSAHAAAADPHTGYLKESDYDANTILKADSDNTPIALSVGASEVVGRKAAGGIASLTMTELKTLLALTEGDITSLTTDLAAKVPKSLYDANSILAATTDDTPAALTVAASTLVGRKASGGIAALTVDEILVLLGENAPGGWDKPTAALAQTLPRTNRMESQSCLISGTLYLQAIWLPGGITVNHISVASGGSAVSGPQNQWFALYDSARGKLRVTNDDTSTAWAGTTIKTLDLASSYTVPAGGGLYYVGVMVKASSSVPSLWGSAANWVASGITPFIGGSSTGSLTDPASAPSTATTPVNHVGHIYAYVS